ncbi:MoaD/ThiS family protein [Planctomycetaceae bacterium]|jgi:sulfur-carrier protein|nr:MoaD/ThiS family protein [Planctomycetaceae bacterium]MDC0308249.1 MoaD/ThiS family protein [Planctomycetaceae bacterium]
MNVTIKLFAQARDLAGTSQTNLSLNEGESVKQMLASLIEEHPALSQIQGNLLVAVNNEYVSSNSLIPTNAEIACFPPVSGG